MTDPKFEARLKRMPKKKGQTIGCLEFQGARTKKGYGRLGRRKLRRSIRAHHYAWFLQHGKWPDDQLLHQCDNPPCCEWTHLFEGSNKDNMQDKTIKGRHAMQIYPDEVILQIRGSTEINAVLARKFGMSKVHVGRIKQNKVRSHLQNELQ